MLYQKSNQQANLLIRCGFFVEWGFDPAERGLTDILFIDNLIRYGTTRINI